jgi:hypothetical protein
VKRCRLVRDADFATPGTALTAATASLRDRSRPPSSTRTIGCRAKRHNLPAGRAYHFEDLTPEFQETIRAVAADRLKGRPVLVFADDPTRWTLLSTREVVGLDRGQVRMMRLCELASVGSASEPPLVASQEEIGRWKGSWEYLRLVGRGGEVSVVWVPRGGEAYALWNILLPHARANRAGRAESP